MRSSQSRIPHQPSEEQLLSRDIHSRADMSDTGLIGTKKAVRVETGYATEVVEEDPSRTEMIPQPDTPGAGAHTEYRVYKIRWFGLGQLILLNIIVSWDVGDLFCPVLHRYIDFTM